MLAVCLLATLLSAEPVELKSETGTLYGTIETKAAKGTWPLVILHAGSGPTDRDGNSPQMKNDSLKQLGDALVGKDYAVFRFDKRGVAASSKAAPKEEELTIDTYANDVVAWVKQLRADGRFTKIIFIGHSEGSVIGSIAASKAKFDAFVSLCGPGRPFDTIICEQIAKDDATLAAKSQVILNAIAKGDEPADVPAVLSTLFRKSVRPYLRSSLANDPAKRFGELTCPALIVSGTTDIQVAEADAKGLSKANPKAKSVRIDEMNHVLKEIKSTNKLVQLTTYNDPKKPLHPKLIDAIASFLATVGTP